MRWTLFSRGLQRRELKEELGRRKPKTVSQLMDIANEWADGEGFMCNDQPRVPDDREYPQDTGCGGNHGYDHRKKIKYPSYDANELTDMVAAGFNTGHVANRRKQEWRQRRNRDEGRPALDGEQLLTGPFPFHPYKGRASQHQVRPLAEGPPQIRGVVGSV